MALADFLQTKRDKAELQTALSVIREFKEHESEQEWLDTMCAAWAMLEQLEGYLQQLTLEGE